MARKPANAETTLKTLCIKRLTALLLEVCDRDDVLAKKVRLLLAAKDNGNALYAEIGKRIECLMTGRSFMDWPAAGDFADTLDALRVAVVTDLSGQDPAGSGWAVVATD